MKSTSKQKIRIGIVGGGPGSVSLCIELKNKLGAQGGEVEVFVFEKNAHIGHGYPYALHEESHLLNLPKEIMEPVVGESDEFVRWLTSRNLNTESDFPPRYLFGQYLEYRAINAQLEAEQQGLTIHYLVNHEVVDVQMRNGLFYVSTVDNEFNVEFLILSTGHMPSSLYQEWIGVEGYIHNPLAEGAFKKIKAHETVCILGSRLTAIDAALKLKRMGHQGTITMVSRSGLLPTVLGKTIRPYDLKYVNKELLTRKKHSLTLQELSALFFKELHELDFVSHLKNIPTSSEDIAALDWMINEITEAEEGNRPWQEFLFALYPLTPHLWPLLKEEDQHELMTTWYSLFITYLAAFPLDNAYHIKNLIESGKLHVFHGVGRVTKNDNAFIISYQDTKFVRSKWLINATGTGYCVSSLPYLKRMLDDNTVTAHPLGGLNADQKSLRVIKKNDEAHRRLYALGELTKGVHFLTTDLGCVTAQAHTIATQIEEELRLSLFDQEVQ